MFLHDRGRVRRLGRAGNLLIPPGRAAQQNKKGEPDAAFATMATEGSSEDIRSRVMGKLRWRIVSYCFVLFIINYLDRVNVGFA